MYPTKLTLALASLALVATPLAAQGRSPNSAQGRVQQSRGPERVPPGHLPPAGMCRIWYDNLPPGRQPAPTSCAVAERRAPRNARVIYGARSDRRNDDWYDRRDGRDGRYDGRDGGWYDRDGNREADRRRVDERDVRRRVDTDCRVRDRYGRCQDNPFGLPRMLSLSDLQRGRHTADYRQWLGDQRYRYRYADSNRDGWPEQIWWLDGGGSVLQYWIDGNRDGRVDRLAVYRNGRVVRVVQ